MIGHIVGTAVLLPAVAEALHAAGIFVHDAVMIEDIAELRRGAHLAAAEADCPDRVFVSHRPCHLVEAMDVLLDIVVAGEPGEVEPVAALPFHVGPARLPRGHSTGPPVL